MIFRFPKNKEQMGLLNKSPVSSQLSPRSSNRTLPSHILSSLQEKVTAISYQLSGYLILTTEWLLLYGSVLQRLDSCYHMRGKCAQKHSPCYKGDIHQKENQDANTVLMDYIPLS